MKKTLALLLAVLVALSMFSVAAFAEEATADKATVIFYDAPTKDGEAVGAEIYAVQIVPGEGQIRSHIPENPVKESDSQYDYTFKGWKDLATGTVYAPSNIPEPTEVGSTTEYVAVYTQSKVKSTQTFLNFIESIFERINLIFQYIAEIFRFETPQEN